MGKRQKLDYDSEELTQNLKQSAGKGVDALFPQLSRITEKPPEKREVVDKDQEMPEGEQVDTTTPRHHDTVVSPHHDTTSPPVVTEIVRKAVKQVGKEAATHRFTQEEKQQLVDIIYSYSRLGYKTSENEITRIAINWLILDYQEQGESSVLNQVLKALKE